MGKCVSPSMCMPIHVTERERGRKREGEEDERG